MARKKRSHPYQILYDILKDCESDSDINLKPINDILWHPDTAQWCTALEPLTVDERNSLWEDDVDENPLYEKYPEQANELQCVAGWIQEAVNGYLFGYTVCNQWNDETGE